MQLHAYFFAIIILLSEGVLATMVSPISQCLCPFVLLNPFQIDLHC
jgi:hypothetical protein